MGLARELSMGPRRPRKHAGTSGDWAALRRLTTAAAPDLTVFRATLDRVAATGERMRHAEGIVYIQACARYRELTGEQYGPTAGTY